MSDKAPLMRAWGCICEYVTTYEPATWGSDESIQEREYVTLRNPECPAHQK